MKSIKNTIIQSCINDRDFTAVISPDHNSYPGSDNPLPHRRH